MIFNQSRDQLRKIWLDAWAAHQQQQPLSTLQQQLVNILLLHPEYHADFNQPEKLLAQDYSPELGQTNPFLHMGMHQGIHEQLATNRPAGIRELYQSLCKTFGDEHQAEHAMMDAFAETLWQAQQNASPPDEQLYLSLLKRNLTN